MATATPIPATTLPAGVTSAPGPAVGISAAEPKDTPAAVSTPAVTPVVAVDRVAETAAKPEDKTAAVVASLTDDLADAPAPIEDSKPAEVTYALKAPEGFDAAQLKAVEEFAKDAKLTNDQAQRILDREAARAAQMQTQAQAQVAQLHNDWKAQAKQQFGPKFNETLKLADRALNMDQAFKAEVLKSPLRSLPAFLGFLAKVGALTREDTPPVGGSVQQTLTKTPAQRWYPVQSGASS